MPARHLATSGSATWSALRSAPSWPLTGLSPDPPAAQAPAECCCQVPACRDRQDALADWCWPLSRRGFDWVKPPVLNPYTRLAVTMSPARAVLRVAGYEMTNADLPEQVTEVCEI